MKWQTYVTTLVITVLVSSTGLAECNRGGGSRGGRGMNSGAMGPMLTSGSLGSPYGSALAQLQLESALARRRAASQMMYRQAFAQQQQQQRRGDSQFASRPKKGSKNSSLASRGKGSSARRDRMLQENAQKALALATRAESKGRTREAKEYYRRVIRTMGPSSELGSQARELLAAMLKPETTTDNEGTILLASID